MTRRGERGVVLVNALILVAVLSAMAVALLQKSQAAQQRRALGQSVAQTDLYLDGVEALVMTVLNRDVEATNLDHLGEGWASARRDVPQDRGAASFTIEDLQGRFNVNWLANPENQSARQAFAALARRIGMPPQIERDIVGLVSPEGLQLPAGADLRLGGGPLKVLDQLKHVPGMTAQHYARFTPYLAALPGDTQLNVNTVSEPVLAAYMTGASTAGVDALIRSRRGRPFLSVEDFSSRAIATIGVEAMADIYRAGFYVKSRWFLAEMRVELGATSATRHTVMKRSAPVGHVDVVYRWVN